MIGLENTYFFPPNTKCPTQSPPKKEGRKRRKLQKTVLYDRALGHPNTRGFYFCLLFVLNDRALGHPNTRGFTFVYFLCSTTEHLATPTQGDLLLFTFCAQRPSTWPPQHKGILLLFTFCAQRPSTWPPQHKGIYFCLLFVLNDRALGHPNTRGFTFVYFLCSTTEHLATPTQGDLLLFTFCAQRPSTWPPQHKGIYFCLLFVLNDRALGHPNTRGFTFVYFLCSTTEHLATPTQGDLLLFTFCAQRPSTWPPQHKGIYFCLLFVLNDRALGHPNTRGFIFVHFLMFLSFYLFPSSFSLFFTNFSCPNKGLYFSLTSLFSYCLLLLLCLFPLPSSLTITGDFNFLLTNYTRHKKNNGKRNT